MTTRTLTYSGELVVTSCWCGIGLAVPRSLYWEAKNGGKQSIYCPLGHTFVYGQSENERLQRELRNANSTAESERRWREQAERSLAATKGVVTKLRGRAHAGTCPFGCRRSFANLQRHVAAKHPGEKFEGET